MCIDDAGERSASTTRAAASGGRDLPRTQANGGDGGGVTLIKPKPLRSIRRRDRWIRSSSCSRRFSARRRSGELPHRRSLHRRIPRWRTRWKSAPHRGQHFHAGARCQCRALRAFADGQSGGGRRSHRELCGVKKDAMRAGAKAGHPGVSGRFDIGAEVNIGAGRSRNYDGFKKHPTRIGDGAFVGEQFDAGGAARNRAGPVCGGRFGGHSRRSLRMPWRSAGEDRKTSRNGRGAAWASRLMG